MSRKKQFWGVLCCSMAAACGLRAEVQRVEGFAEVVFAHNNHPSATVQVNADYRGRARGYMTGAWWAAGQRGENRVEWKTAACPEKKDTILIFIGASATLPPEINHGPEVRLSVNGEEAVRFRIGTQRDFSWAKGEYRLRYSALRNEFASWGRQRQFELEGNSGRYELLVPASRITPGEPLVLKAEMLPFPRWPNGWFMVKARRDALSDSPQVLREEIRQLRADTNRLGELVQVLATRQYPDLLGQDRFTHRTVYSNGYRHVHPADLIPLRDGTLLLTAREATEHVANDGDIVILRSRDGITWGERMRFGVADLDEREACGIQLPDGSVLLAVFYNAMYRPDGEYEQKWRDTVPFGEGKQNMGIYTVRSRDGGRTWSAPKFVRTTGMPFTDTEGPADAPVLLPDGTLLLPVIGYNVRGDLDNHASVLLASQDDGETWEYRATIADDPGGRRGHFQEPGLVRTRSGKLIAAMRNNHGNVYIATSKDDGRSWSDAKPSPMIGHPADLIQLKDGRILCTYGVREPHHGAPSGVRAAWSEDEGETWKIEEEVQLRNDFLNWDVGYPESLELPDGRVLTVYYFNLFGRYFLGATLWRP